MNDYEEPLAFSLQHLLGDGYSPANVAAEANSQLSWG